MCLKVRNDFSSKMQKNEPTEFTNDDISPTKIYDSGYSLMDPPGYIKPSLQDFLLTDIDSKKLRIIAASMELEYLGLASFPGSFPVEGIIWAPNHRLMVNLVCRRQSKSLSHSQYHLFA